MNEAAVFVDPVGLMVILLARSGHRQMAVNVGPGA